MVKRLKSEGYWVRGVDLKESEFAPSLDIVCVVGDEGCLPRRVAIAKGAWHAVPRLRLSIR
jgi:hypothetical protein